MIEGPQVARFATGTGWRRIGERRERGCFGSRVGHEGRGWMVGRWECVEGKKGNDKSSRRGDDASQATPGGGAIIIDDTLGRWGDDQRPTENVGA